MNNFSHRISAYKQHHSPEVGRRRRQGVTNKIRKTKKEERLAKCRYGASKATPGTTAVVNVSNTTTTTNYHERPPTPQQLHDVIHCLQTTTDATMRFEAVQTLRRILSLEKDSPVKTIVDSGILATLTSFLPLGEQPHLLFETLWALTNIASSSYTAAIVQAGALPGIVNCLWHDNANVREQAIWCVGNVAGDSPQLRDEALKLGALKGVIENLNDPNHESLYNNAVWTFSNLLRAKPRPDIRFVKEAGPCLAMMLGNPKNKESLVDSLWAMSYASDGENERITAVMQDQPQVVTVLVNLLEHVEPSSLMPLVRSLGNFCSGNEEQTQLVVNAGITNYNKRVLNCPKKNVQKEWCWLMSNIAAGTQDQIASLFTSQGGLSLIVHKAMHAEWDIRKEAIWVLTNIFSGGSDDQIDELVRLEGIEAICSALQVDDVEILKEVMSALECILAAGERHGTNYKIVMDECHGITNLEALQEHSNDEIYHHVIKIIDEYFGAVDEEEDENLMPAANEDTFEFGMDPSRKLFGDSASAGAAPQAQQPFQEFNFGNSSGL